MKLINRALFILTIIAWTAFFLEIWNVTNYWAGVAIIFGLLVITAGYILTKPSSIKAMTEDEPDNVNFSDEEIMDMLQKTKVDLDPEAFGEATGHLEFRNWRSPDWQECYEIAEKDELDREANKIIKEVSEACREIEKGDYDAPRV